MRDMSKDVKAGEYVVEVRRTQREKAGVTPPWAPAHVYNLAFASTKDSPPRAVRSYWYFPWQAEAEAEAMLDKALGVAAVTLGALEVRVRCITPAQNVPVGAAVTRNWVDPNGTPSEFGRTQAATVDTRPYFWEAQPDHDGELDVADTCRVTGNPLHPIYGCRTVCPGVDPDDAEEPAPRKKAKKKAKKKEPEPEGPEAPEPEHDEAEEAEAEKATQLPPGAEF